MSKSVRSEEIGVPEDRYRLLVDAITDYAIYMLDPGGVVTSWNPGAERFKGYSAGEIIGRHFSEFYTPEDRAAGMPQAALRAAAQEGRFEREAWRVRKDGARFWAHVIIDPIRTPEGKLIGYAKVTRDLTDRRAAEEALRQSQEQFRLLVQGVTDYAIYLLDKDGHVSSWNAGAERIKGYTLDEVLGKHVSTFYAEEDRQAGTPALGLATALREGRWEHEGWRVRKDGSRFWAHVVLDAIRDDKGEVIGFAKVTRDITERMEAQKALEEARDALFQSQKLDAIGQLTGGVAHDFNNLLMAVLGSLELVKKRLPYDPRISPLLDNAIHGAQRGATLTQRMLAFARKQELRLEPVNLEALTLGMTGFLQRTIGPSVTIATNFQPGLPAVVTDPAQLESALLNLVVNARDAMPEGGTVTIGAELAQAGGSATPLVRLSVSDTGEGMDAETLARATEPFFTTKGVGKGTGLGLSIVHGLAAQSGGRMTLKSQPGRGTTVEIALPVAKEDAASATQSQDAPAAPRYGRRTVLAVDDDPLVLLNTAALLEDLGHQVISAETGKEALSLLESRPDIDILVTDQAMPGMTGLDLRERARTLRPNLPVIVATGFAELPAEGQRDFVQLPKPFTQAHLDEALQQALEFSLV